MASIQVDDRQFVPYLSHQEILDAVQNIATRINIDLEGTNPLFIAILNGSFMFASDLMKFVTIESEITFIRMKSYQGTSSTGCAKMVYGLDEDIEGRTIVIVEDIVDTGHTMKRLLELLGEKNPKEIKIATLLHKPNATEVDLPLDYIALSIPNDFIVGYGLDYNEKGRNLRDIYVIE